LDTSIVGSALAIIINVPGLEDDFITVEGSRIDSKQLEKPANCLIEAADY
jgi:hypothetical protein